MPIHEPAASTHAAEAARTRYPPLGRVGRLALPLIVAIGVGVRVVVYLMDPTLFIDEAMLALNVLLRTPAELFQPLQFEQISPVLFLLAEQGAVALAGASTFAFRFLPIVCAILVTVATPLLARRFVSPRAAVIAAGLIALSPELLANAYRIKPYASDAAITVGLIAIALGLSRRLEAGRTWALLAVIGGLAVLFSLPAVFVLAGVGSWLAVRARSQRHARSYFFLAAVAAAWIAPALLLYRFVYTADADTNAYLAAFWRNSFVFARTDLSFPQQLAVFGRGSLDPLLGWSRQPATVAIAATAFLAGAVALIRQRGTDALLLLIPLAAAWIAYLFGLYVAVGRLFDFAAPLLAIVVAAGIDRMARLAPPRWQTATASVLVLPVFAFQLYGSAVLLALVARDDGGAIRETLRVAAPEEPIYIYMRVLPDWIFYTTDWRAPDMQRVSRLILAAEQAGPNSGNAPPDTSVAARAPRGHSFPFRSSSEIIGTRSGVVLGPDSYLNESIVAGWGEREIDRIASTGRPTTWALFWNETPPLAPFVRAAERLGGCVTTHDDTRLWMVVYKVQFPCQRLSATSP